MISFVCNICGSNTPTPPPESRHRELFDCSQCGSCARFRGLILALQSSLGLDQRIPLAHLAPRKQVIGVGLSDDDRYASLLHNVFSYTNTFYHTHPRFDVTTAIYGEAERNDFIICSEILEHVTPPVNTCLTNLFRMLKPGGTLILSTPFLDGYDTIEHFPHLHDYRIESIDSVYQMVNTTPLGTTQTFRDLVFHGGPGATLEMRVFGKGDLLARLQYVGYQNIRFLAPNRWDIGYAWEFHPESPLHKGRLLMSEVIMAQRPL